MLPFLLFIQEVAGLNPGMYTALLIGAAWFISVC